MKRSAPRMRHHAVPEEVYRESVRQMSLAVRLLFAQGGVHHQSDAAAILGMAESQLSRLLSGGVHDRGARTDTLVRIAWNFGRRLVIDFEADDAPVAPSPDRLQEVIGALTQLQVRWRRVGRHVAADELVPILELATGKRPPKV